MDRAAILALIPHAGSMCLLDEVASWDEAAVHCRSRSHQSSDNPLRREGRLDALHLIEYAAQATAVHGGLLARRDGGAAQPGMLTSVRDLVLGIETLDAVSNALDVHAKRCFSSPAGWLYDFEVRAGDMQLASGRLSVMIAPSTPSAGAV